MPREQHQYELLWSRAQVEAATAELEWLSSAPRELISSPCLTAVQYKSPLGSARLKAFAFERGFAEYLGTHGYLADRTLLIHYPRRHSGLLDLQKFVLERVKAFLEEEKLGLFEIE